MGVPIAQHQAVAFMIADMCTGTEAGRLLVYKSAQMIDAGKRNTLFASMAKSFCADHAQKVCYDAIQVFGGAGFNTEMPVEKLYRDARIFVRSFFHLARCASGVFSRPRASLGLTPCFFCPLCPDNLRGYHADPKINHFSRHLQRPFQCHPVETCLRDARMGPRLALMQLFI